MITNTHYKGRQTVDPEWANVAGRKTNDTVAKASEVVGANGDPCIESVKKIDDKDLGKPAKES